MIVNKRDSMLCLRKNNIILHIINIKRYEFEIHIQAFMHG